MNKQLLLEYKDLEENLVNDETVLKELKRLFEKENHFEERLSQIEIKKKALSDLKQKISEEARAEFKETGSKKLEGGIGIRETTVLNYDKDTAFKWAKEHELCLSLDSKSFEKLALSQNIEFVEKNTEVKVTFPEKIQLND